MGGSRRRRAAADGEPCRVSAVDALEDASSRRRPPPRDAAGLGGASRRRAWASRGFGDFWQHCLVAEGALDVAADPELQLWDYAAVQLLVEEAGGRCSTFGGGAARAGSVVLSTNGVLHDDVVTLLATASS